jgi:hypothetical protein
VQGAFGQRAALIEAQESGSAGFLFDDDSDVLDARAKVRRDTVDGSGDERVEVARAHWFSVYLPVGGL